MLMNPKSIDLNQKRTLRFRKPAIQFPWITFYHRRPMFLARRGGAAITAAGKPGGEKRHGTYVVGFRTAAGVLAVPRTEAGVIRHLQERVPSGLFVPDVP